MSKLLYNIEFYVKKKVFEFYLVTSTRTGASGSSSNTVAISLNKRKLELNTACLIKRQPFCA